MADSVNHSIHPRATKSTPKNNTSRSPKRETLARTILAIETHLLRHPKDDVSVRHVEKVRKALKEIN